MPQLASASRWPLLASLAGLVAVPSGAAFGHSGPRPVTAVVGATLVDVSHKGRTTNDIFDAAVLIEDGKISYAGLRTNIKIPPHSHIIDARGKFLIPGLIDGYGAVRSSSFVRAYLYEGVTSVLVPIASPKGELDGETNVVADTGNLSTLTAIAIDGTADLTQAVDAAAQRGASAILIGYDVIPNQLSAVVREAHLRRLAVLAELASTGYATAIKSGVDAFARHDKYQLWLSKPSAWAEYTKDPRGTGARAAMRSICGSDGIDETISEFGLQLKGGRTALMPVLAMEATADDVGSGNPWKEPAAAFFSPADLDDPVDPVTGARPFLQANPERQQLIRSCAIRKRQIDVRLHDKGAVFLTGSSAPGYGVMPGSGVHLEIKLLQQIGLTPREALAAATGNFATYFHWNDRGLIAKGRRADLVLLDADPRKDASAIDSVASVFAAGREIDRHHLLEEAKQVGSAQLH